MSFRRFALVFAALLVGFGAEKAQAQEFEVLVDETFTQSEIEFISGVAPHYTVIYDLRLVNGQVTICGSGYLRDRRFNSTIRDMLRNSTLQVGGRLVSVNLTYFSRAHTRIALRSMPANSRSSLGINTRPCPSSSISVA